MRTSSRIQVLSGVALIAAMLGIYVTTLHVDGLAKSKYLYKQSDHMVKRKAIERDYPIVSKLRQQKVHTKVIDAKLNQIYVETLNSTLEYIFQYTYPQELEKNQALSVQITSSSAFRENPILVVVRQQKGVVSWQLPLLLETIAGMQEYSSVGRTLCTEPLKHNITLEHEFFLGVSTSDPNNISFVASVTPVEDFVVEMDVNYTVTLSASEPKYYQFMFPEGVTNVLLSLTSDEISCMSVSIQNLTCPVFDTDHDLKYEGIWQTLMNKTGMTISRERFPYGFFVVFVVKADDYECTGVRELPPPLRSKTLHFVIHEKVSYVNFMVAVIGILAIFALFYVVAFITFCSSCSNHVPDELECSLLEVEQRRVPSYGALSATPVVGSIVSVQEAVRRSTSSLDITDIDLMADAFSDKDVIRTKTFIFVSDLARKGPRFHGKKTQLYMWNLLIVAVFYALPVLQLVIIYQKVLNDTGDQDLCYYNFLCAHPLGDLTDFNHVYSNLGYVLLGLLFIINTARRDVLRRKAQERNDRLEKYYGIPQHYGLFYAMGTALMVEGILSACYHICPTHANYQFDTTFMYVISMLMMLKIYQTRHPDINAEAHAAFAVLAFVVLLGVISVFADSLIFRITFSALHLLSCLALCAQIYYMGRWRLDLGVFKRIYLVCWNDFQAGPANWFRPMYVDRMVLLTFAILTNVALVVYGLYEQPIDFASYVLAIFITNLMLYTMFYIIMKLRHGEKILCQPLLYIILSTVCWGAAMYFFINKAITWRKRAAESRTFNQECVILNFYDFHDIWHFLSATSLFFSFMILLTLDDDLQYTPRDRIPVF